MLKNNEFRGVARIINIIAYDLIFENKVYFLRLQFIKSTHMNWFLADQLIHNE